MAKTWTQLNPPGSPSPRLAPLAYDAATQTVVLFGGGNIQTLVSGGIAYGDTWNWNGTTWVQALPASSPSARTLTAMSYSPELVALVLFGGAVGGDWVNSADDTWTWNGINWTQIQPATVPPNRYAFGMAYDPVDKVVLMFGGFSTADARGGPWFLAVTP